MIHDSVIDICLNALQSHFGSNLILRPPASLADLAKLEKAAGTLPRDLKVFLVTCDGLRIKTDASLPHVHLWHVHEMLETMSEECHATLLPGLLPIRGNVDAECDLLVTDPGHMFGRVVRRDPWKPGAVLFASTFGRYIDGWSRFLIESFDANGVCHQEQVPPFEHRHVTVIDAELPTTAEDDEVKSWLRQLSVIESGGSDF